jgi:hypothetical protein
VAAKPADSESDETRNNSEGANICETDKSDKPDQREYVKAELPAVVKVPSGGLESPKSVVCPKTALGERSGTGSWARDRFKSVAKGVGVKQPAIRLQTGQFAGMWTVIGELVNRFPDEDVTSDEEKLVEKTESQITNRPLGLSATRSFELK